jgi:hypothetical protein
MLLMGILLLTAGRSGPAVWVAHPASAGEPAATAVVPEDQPPAAADESRVKKKGRVRIAVLGPRPLAVDVKADSQKLVEQEIAHWRREFAQVLPDRPDLIVVPEACDRPAGLGREKGLDYCRVRKNQVRDFFAKVATENHCYVVYSAIRATAGHQRFDRPFAGGFALRSAGRRSGGLVDRLGTG